MPDRKTTIERAFELAATGRYRTITEIRAALRQDRYEMVDSTLAGRGIRDQLRRLMSAARGGLAEDGATEA
ncbi:MAG: hypothetical protein J0I28_02370 [Caulobacterales bacterium]|nr:hypothetical protein [Caulobacterales bacterium]